MKEEKSGDKRAQILAAAEQLFAQKDFDAVSVRELAAAAGVNLAMISYYFGSKEKLLEALIETKMQLSFTAIQELERRDAPAMEKILAVADWQVDRIMQNRYFQRIIFREMLHNTRPEINSFIIKNIDRNRRLIHQIIQQGIDRKEFRGVDTDMVLLSFYATINHLVSACRYSMHLFQKNSEQELFTPDFSERVKNHLKSLLKAMLQPTISSI
ncbi:MAG: TetR family transcriptional regulator [Chitinophagales bacterium]